MFADENSVIRTRSFDTRIVESTFCGLCFEMLCCVLFVVLKAAFAWLSTRF